METQKQAVRSARDVIAFAKKHRIGIEDAQKVLDQYGADQKSADKAARRIAV